MSEPHQKNIHITHYFLQHVSYQIRSKIIIHHFIFYSSMRRTNTAYKIWNHKKLCSYSYIVRNWKDIHRNKNIKKKLKKIKGIKKKEQITRGLSRKVNKNDILCEQPIHSTNYTFIRYSCSSQTYNHSLCIIMPYGYICALYTRNVMREDF